MSIEKLKQQLLEKLRAEQNDWMIDSEAFVVVLHLINNLTEENKQMLIESDPMLNMKQKNTVYLTNNFFLHNLQVILDPVVKNFLEVNNIRLYDIDVLREYIGD